MNRREAEVALGEASQPGDAGGIVTSSKAVWATVRVADYLTKADRTLSQLRLARRTVRGYIMHNLVVQGTECMWQIL
jgi:hypothetical protein